MTSQMKETFGEYIKRLRTENELTLTQLAAKLDLDSANLSKIENNKREFDEKRLELLANVFNLDLANFGQNFLAT
jgi:transcriptional regulator with XRE-family HTH domain